MNSFKEHNKIVVERLTKNPHKLTYKELSFEFKKTEGGIRALIHRMKLTHLVRPEYEKYRADRIQHEAKRLGLEPESVDHGWIKTEEASLHFRNDLPKVTLEEITAQNIEAMRKHSPKYPKLSRDKNKDPHALVLDLADVHFGKLSLLAETGQDYNLDIAEQRCMEGLQGLLAKSSGFQIDHFYLIIGNDIIHTDTPKRTTTSGIPQDTDGQLWEMWLRARDVYVKIIEQLLALADVTIVYNPSNHDYMSGYFLAQTIQAWFRHSKNITFDVTIRHRKYFTYGNNLICTTHGDGAKHADMPYLMAHEHPDWNNTEKQFRYIYLHHLHHNKRTKWQNTEDTHGVTMEILRSPSAPDGWHDRNGYSMAPMAVEGFIHSKQNGQVARLSHYF